MPDFTAKMDQIRFRTPTPAGGAHIAPRGPLAEFTGMRGVGKDLARGRETGKRMEMGK